MSPRFGQTGPGTLSDGLAALLDSSSEVLGAAILLKSAAREEVFGAIPLPHCSSCRPAGAEGSRECEARRDLALRNIGNPTEYEHWIGPCGCEVTVVAVPRLGGIPLGLVAVRPANSAGPRTVNAAETVRFLSRLARIAAEQMTLTGEHAQAVKKLAQTRDELDLLTAISGRLEAAGDPRLTIHQLLEQACRATGADGAIVQIAQRRILEVATSELWSIRLPSSSRTWRRLAERVNDHFQIQDRRFFSGLEQQLGGDSPLFQEETQILAVSIPIQSEVLGILTLVHLSGALLRRESEMKLIESVAERIGMVVTSHDLYEDLKSFQLATVKSLVSMIEAKDPYTSGHSERVHILSMLLGRSLKLGDEEMEVLKWASILHDIGKIGMPERILNKPGKLTPAEFETMKEHPERGYKVLAPIHQLAAASLAVRSHHEMINGCGYPMGLHGDEIPRIARIISVADTYDALTSSRAYRPRRSPDLAFSVIASVRGSQLDPVVVDAMEMLLPFIREHEVMIQTGVIEQTPHVYEQPEAEAA